MDPKRARDVHTLNNECGAPISHVDHNMDYFHELIWEGLLSVLDSYIDPVNFVTRLS
jgi:hypothetical protein